MSRAVVRRNSYEVARYVNKVEYLTDNDYMFLLAAAEHQEHKVLLQLLWETGLRISEALNLRYTDIYPDGVNIMGKGGKQRFIPGQTPLLGALMRYRDLHGNVKVFQKVTTPAGAYLMMKRLARKAGLDDKKIHPHLFRHSFAINFIKQTGDPFSLQDILGHANMDMVKVYMRLAKQAPQDSIRKMVFPSVL